MKPIIKWIVVVLVALAICGIFLLVAIQVNRVMEYPDFLVYWAAGKLIGQGQSPFVAEVFKVLMGELNWSFAYPMVTGIFFVPWGLMPYRLAYLTWIFLSMVLILSSVLLLVRASKINNPYPYLLPIIAGVATFRPVIVAIRNGQIVPFLLFALVLTIFFFQKDKPILSGVMCSVLIFKPSIGLPIMGLIALWYLVNRQYKAFIALGLGSIFLFSVGFLIEPQWIRQVLSYEGNQTIIGRFRFCPTFWGLANLACSDRMTCVYTVGTILSLAALGVFGFALFTRRTDIFSVASLAASISLLISPYAWTYEHVLLVVPILFIFGALVHRSAPFIVSALIFLLFSILSIILLFVGVEISLDMWSGFLPLTCFVGTLLLTWRGTTIDIRGGIT